jgi:hypothetical protein
MAARTERNAVASYSVMSKPGNSWRRRRVAVRCGPVNRRTRKRVKMAAVGHVVLPGDVVKVYKIETDSSIKIVLGPGVRQLSDSIVVTKPGLLRFREPAVYWVDSHQKRVGGVAIKGTRTTRTAICHSRSVVTRITRLPFPFTW